MKKRFQKAKKRRRNAAPITPRRFRSARASSRPDWRTTLAALAGGAGSAALGGLVVNQEILSPEAVGIGMIGLGGATAYFADGNARVVGNSVAAAGAGQLALALMARRALGLEKRAVQPSLPQTPARLSAGPGGGPPRKSATGGGVVIDLFRDAAQDLEDLDAAGWGVEEPIEVEEAEIYEEDEDAA